MSEQQPDPVPVTMRRRRVRRAPNIARFLIVGALVGIVLGLVVGSRGSAGSYSDGTAMGLLAVLFGAVGALVAAVVALVLDRRSRRVPADRPGRGVGH